jgi:hypothetical protein
VQQNKTGQDKIIRFYLLISRKEAREEYINVTDREEMIRMKK